MAMSDEGEKERIVFGFGPKRALSADEWEWHLAAFKWLDETIGAGEPRQPLVTPTVDFFPPSRSKGAERAAELLDQVQCAAAMEQANWPVRLAFAGDDRPHHVPVAQGMALFNPGQGIAGTFQTEEVESGGWQAVITLSPVQLESEMGAIATLAHELAHYLLATVERPVPGGEDCHELLTDLTAVYMGFGIFLGNSARHSAIVADDGGQWFQSGWQGYLSERALMTALTIQETLAGRDPLAACAWLKPHLAKDVKLAARYIARRDLAADIAAVDLADYGAAP